MYELASTVDPLNYDDWSSTSVLYSEVSLYLPFPFDPLGW